MNTPNCMILKFVEYLKNYEMFDKSASVKVTKNHKIYI